MNLRIKAQNNFESQCSVLFLNVKLVLSFAFFFSCLVYTIVSSNYSNIYTFCKYKENITRLQKATRGHLIGCQGVKLFLLNNFCQKWIFVTIWIFEFSHNSSHYCHYFLLMNSCEGQFFPTVLGWPTDRQLDF